MPKKKSNRQPKLIMLTALALGILGLLFFYKNQFVVAWVNGRPVSRLAYVRELEKLGKNQAIDSLTTKQLINAEAKNKKINVDAAEIDAAMETIAAKAKEQGTSLDELLTAQGITESMVREEVRLQKLLEKMVTVSDPTEEEINQYWKDNQLYYPDQKLEEVLEDITGQLKQQKMIGAVQELIATLQSQAKIVNWLN